MPNLATTACQSRPAQASGRPADWTFDVSWADCEADVAAAQKLRYEIFAGELGARLPLAAIRQGRDADRFDPFCDHLLVWARDCTGMQPPQLVGTYRVLGPEGARRCGGWCADDEFDMGSLASLRPSTIELGRACVRADWRSGGVIMSLWSALGRYMVRRDLDAMVGCASVGMGDGGHFAASLWSTLRQTHLADPAWQVEPRNPLQYRPRGGALSEIVLMREMPPLIKGYLRGGAKVLGAPSYDPSFNTADLPIMMRMADLAPRYRTQFLAP